MARPSTSADNIVARAGSPTNAATSAMIAPLIIPSAAVTAGRANMMAAAVTVGKRGDRECGQAHPRDGSLNGSLRHPAAESPGELYRRTRRVVELASVRSLGQS